MEQMLVDFVKVLRNADLKVSPAETLEAMECLDIVGYRDREFLKDGLSMVLAKNTEEKEAFFDCFDKFFTVEKFAPSGASAANDETSSEDDSFDDEFEPDDRNQEQQAGNGQGSGSGSGEGQSSEQESEADQLKATSELGKMLTEGSRTEQTIAMLEAGRKVEVNKIVVFTQKGLFTRKIMDAMGLKGLQEEVATLKGEGGRPQNQLAGKLTKARDELRERVRDFVEKQFFLHADESGKQLREELLKKVKLSNLEKRNFRDVQEIVFKMAKKLISIHSKRRKTYKRGQLDVRKTLRHNMQYDGMFFDLKWKATKVDRPKVMCICDVSGSVSSFSRFLLMFLYSLSEVIPKVRSFVFSSDLGEVTKLFEHNNLEDAMARTMRDYGNGSTDYGRMLLDFKKHCMHDVDNKTTIIILGDARNNYGDAKAEVVREMYEKAKRVIWLNPEPRSSWSVGDAEMKKYAANCHQTEVCNSLQHLERVVSNLLKTAS